MICPGGRDRRILSLITCLAAAWLPAVCSGAAAMTPIVERGQARAQIVLAEKPARMARLAATELQTYVEKISGATLPIATTPSQDWPLHIFVGASDHTERLGITDAGLRDGAYRMVSGPGYLVLLGRDQDFEPREPWARSHGDKQRALAEWDAITGATWDLPGGGMRHRQYSAAMDLWAMDERGSLNAVYDLLRSLGVRWYMPGPLGEIVPRLATISCPEVSREVHPEFALRAIHLAPFFLATRDDLLWSLRLGVNQHSDAMGLAELHMHGMRDFYSRPEVEISHPEFFVPPAPNAKPGRDRVCLSSPALFQEHVRYIRTLYDHFDMPMASVFPADGYDVICPCEACQAQVSPQLGWHGQHSEYVWAYANRVAEELYKTHPDRLVACIAYNTYRMPPRKLETLSPNLVVGIHQWRLNFHDRANRRSFVELRDAWRKLLGGRKLLIWEGYPATRPGGSSHGVPHYFPHQIAEDLRSLAGISYGEFVEVPLDPQRKLALHAPGFNHLNVYVTARLYWNVDADVDALLDAYCRDFYGPAHAQMRALIDYCEANAPHMGKDAQRIDRALAMLAEARQQVEPDSVFAKRLALLDAYMEPLVSLRHELAESRQDTPKVTIPARDGAIIALDGALDEATWDGLPAFALRELTTGDAPAAATSFKAFWHDGALYLGITCQEPDGTPQHADIAAHDDPRVFDGDCLELLLETPQHAYYQIVISPRGAVTDIDRAHGINTGWASQVQVAATAAPGKWTVELRLPTVTGTEAAPLRGIAGEQPSESAPWYFNLCRQRIREGGNTFAAFSPTGTGRFHEVEKFARLTVAP